jgi:hypothetical protein
VAGQTCDAATNGGGGEAVPRRVGGRELVHDVARQRVVGGDRPTVGGGQDELTTAPRRRHRAKRHGRYAAESRAAVREPAGRQPVQ